MFIKFGWSQKSFIMLSKWRKLLYSESLAAFYAKVTKEEDKIFFCGSQQGTFFQVSSWQGQSESTASLPIHLTNVHWAPTMCETLEREDKKDRVPFLMEQSETTLWPKLWCNHISDQRLKVPAAPHTYQVVSVSLYKACLVLQLLGAPYLVGEDFPAWAVY